VSVRPAPSSALPETSPRRLVSRRRLPPRCRPLPTPVCPHGAWAPHARTSTPSSPAPCRGTAWASPQFSLALPFRYAVGFQHLTPLLVASGAIAQRASHSRIRSNPLAGELPPAGPLRAPPRRRKNSPADQYRLPLVGFFTYTTESSTVLPSAHGGRRSDRT
jgi:hypothetical protein